MGRLEDYPHTDLHLLTLELVEKHADPVVWAGDLMDDPAMTASKVTLLQKLRDLEEWGILRREEMGQTFVYWPPENGYDHLKARIKELEEENGRLEGRVETLDDELQRTKAELEEARAKVVMEADGPRIISREGIPDPPRVPVDVEKRWRVRMGGWRRSFFKASGVFVFSAVLMATYVTQISLVSQLPEPLPDTITVAFLLFLLLALAGSLIWATAFAVGYVSLYRPSFGEWADGLLIRLEDRDWGDLLDSLPSEEVRPEAPPGEENSPTAETSAE